MRRSSVEATSATAVHGGTTMLVLARAENEIIRIGDDIQIVVVSIQSNRVRLGITAPKSLPIDRQEIYEKKKRKGKEKGSDTVLGA